MPLNNESITIPLAQIKILVNNANAKCELQTIRQVLGIYDDAVAGASDQYPEMYHTICKLIDSKIDKFNN